MKRTVRLAVAAVGLSVAAIAPTAGAAQASSAVITADLTTPSLVTCQTATLFGNSDGTHSTDPITTLPAGTRVGWRYDIGHSSMVLWYQGGVWGFMNTDCLAIGAG